MGGERECKLPQIKGVWCQNGITAVIVKRLRGCEEESIDGSQGGEKDTRDRRCDIIEITIKESSLKREKRNGGETTFKVLQFGKAGGHGGPGKKR